VVQTKGHWALQKIYAIFPRLQEMLASIQQLTEERGMAVILVEQHARQILPLTKQALVLERGKSVYLGPAQKLLDDSALLDSWLGVAAH
jgi:branched-chain amino acid transport system ATP-binding protein